VFFLVFRCSVRRLFSRLFAFLPITDAPISGGPEWRALFEVATRNVLGSRICSGGLFGDKRSSMASVLSPIATYGRGRGESKEKWWGSPRLHRPLGFNSHDVHHGVRGGLRVVLLLLAELMLTITEHANLESQLVQGVGWSQVMMPRQWSTRGAGIEMRRLSTVHKCNCHGRKTLEV
jgi:hypothetical protein